MTSSAKKTYRIGLLGAGFMGRTHTYCWRVMEQFYGGCGFHVELGAVCTSNEKSARAACEALGFKRWHTDTAALINDPAVDIIDIASPNRFHYEALSAALACGKPVYCDKPLTGNLAQAEALARLRSINRSRLIHRFAGD